MVAVVVAAVVAALVLQRPVLRLFPVLLRRSEVLLLQHLLDKDAVPVVLAVLPPRVQALRPLLQSI